MLIELEYPFCVDWSKGYLRTCKKDGRTRVDLINSNTDRTTVTYARYLLGVKIGRYLTEQEEADHINNDCTDDSIENLQVLSIEEHKAKTKLHVEGRTYLDCVCSYCGKEFQREKRHMQGLKTLCSRSCNAKYNREFGSWTGLSSGHTEDDLETIAEFRKTGLSDYAIAPLMGMHRSKIQRLRKLNNIP